MEIQGEIKTVIFNNPETGYTVLDVAIGSGEVITAVGIFPPVAEAERVVLRGTFKNNSRHGYQFVTENVEVYPPEQAEAIVKYLSRLRRAPLLRRSAPERWTSSKILRLSYTRSGA